MTSVIEADRLSRKYKNLQALKDLSFLVEKGEIFGFLGPNGAGKTTTIKILTAQLSPDSGRALILGKNVAENPGFVKNNIGVVFEDQNFYPRLTVNQNLQFFADLYHRKKEDITRVLKHVGLEHKKDEEAQKLSRGLKQRLMIARALLPDPPIIFLDEPTVGLDPHVAREIRRIFKDLKARGTTVFLTTHYMEEADELCDRVAIINHGTIIKCGAPRELKEELGSGEITIRTEDERTLTFRQEDPEGIKALEELMKNKVRFRISSEKVSLEDVFITLTGESLDTPKDPPGQ